MKRLLLLLITVSALLPTWAQQANWSKLSPMLRQMVRQQVKQSPAPLPSPAAARLQRQPSSPEVCAFVRINDADTAVLSDYGCRDLTAVGDIHIASIPVDRLALLSLDTRVQRIEARPRGRLLLDTVAHCVNAVPIYEGTRLPQAYSGNGVVIGLTDVGFDFTHPTFRRADGSLRIRRFWDMLSTDTVGSTFYVGRDYVTSEEILNLSHSRDGLEQTHGTHTAGIAAGNGYDSRYRGLAPESDICLVANAVSDNIALIDSALLSRYNFVTDALGFKYLFDYASEQNQPCVVSFSEGSSEDFFGYDQLYYEMIDRLLGPGHIMVVAAGNQGQVKSWFSKSPGTEPMGLFPKLSGSVMMMTMKSSADFKLRFVSYPEGAPADTLTVTASNVLELPDSILTIPWTFVDSIAIGAYPNCYAPNETCYDVAFYSLDNQIGTQTPLSIEVLDNGAEVACWRVNGDWTTNVLNPLLNAGECTHNILSPGTAPRVICVGATTHRDGITNYLGERKAYWHGKHGMRAPFSSIGPTMDGRVKPDVMAPGNNIISSYNSYYLENNLSAPDIKWDVAHFDYEGRTYAWNCNTGTSMACPVVAGTIALWLQAKPDLTPEDIMGVISRTSRQPEPDLDYPNNFYGYGEIDAYRGLLDILGLDHVDGLSLSHTTATVSYAAGNIRVILQEPLSQPIPLLVFSLDGRLLQRVTLPAYQTEHNLPLGRLSAGVYAIQLDGPPSIKGSTLIRVTSY